MELSRSQQKKKDAAKLQNGRCFYCTLRMPHDDMTWEHLVARAHGGNDKWRNLRVAHQKCNVLVADAPVSIKLRFHDIGLKYGSDAFFVTAERVMKLHPGTLAAVGIRKRARRMKKSEWAKAPYELRHAFDESLRIALEIIKRKALYQQEFAEPQNDNENQMVA